MVVLLETKMVDHKNLTELINFDAYLEYNAIGRKEGIVIMWKGDPPNLHISYILTQEIHSIVKVSGNPSLWFFFVIYTSPDYNTLLGLW